MLLSANFSGWFIVIGSASFLVLLIFFFLLFIQYTRKRITHMREVLSLQKKFEQTLLQSQLEIQEQTFSYISQEIHDNIGQVLSLVRLNLNTLDNDPNKLEVTDQLVEQAITDLRSLSHNLNAQYIIETGLVKATERLLENLSKTGRYQTHLTNALNDFQFLDDQSIILFRIIQEIVNNIVKHAEADKISIRIEGNEQEQRISISDNGKGFETENKIPKNKGIGISNMINRAKLIGANVSFISSVLTGTTVEIKIQPKLFYESDNLHFAGR